MILHHSKVKHWTGLRWIVPFFFNLPNRRCCCVKTAISLPGDAVGPGGGRSRLIRSHSTEKSGLEAVWLIRQECKHNITMSDTQTPVFDSGHPLDSPSPALNPSCPLIHSPSLPTLTPVTTRRRGFYHEVDEVDNVFPHHSGHMSPHGQTEEPSPVSRCVVRLCCGLRLARLSPIWSKAAD